MSEFTIRLENEKEIEKNLKDAVKGAQGIYRAAMVKATAYVQSSARGKVAYKTGNLRRQILTRVDPSPLKGVIGVGPAAPYGKYVEFGTRPHVILPRNKKALFWPGADHPVRAVRHPGTKAQPFMQPAATQSKDHVNQIFKEATELIARKAAGK